MEINQLPIISANATNPVDSTTDIGICVSNAQESTLYTY